MPRRRLTLVAVFALLVLVGIGAWLLWPPSTMITRANADSIRAGMTIAEVEEILGGPPRDESTGPVIGEEADISGVIDKQPLWFIEGQRFRPEAFKGLPPGAALPLQWQSNEANVTVAFTADGRVSGAGYLPVHRETPLEWLRRKLGW